MGLLDSTEESFDLMGIVMSGWRGNPGCRRKLAEKTAGGCRARILMMHEDNPALAQLNERSPEWVRAKIHAAREYWMDIARECANVEMRQLARGIPYCGVTITDDEVVAQQLFYSITTNSPIWRASRDSYLYDAISGEFEALWRLNQPDPSQTDSKAEET